jgi:hypothetical protein
MNSKFTRSEHLLWMIPIIYGVVVYFTSYTDIVMSFYAGAYILVTFPQLITGFLISLILPFILQWELRDHQLRDKIISWSHILLSIGIVVAVLFIYSFTLPININWVFNSGTLPAVQKWIYYNNMAVLLIKCFLSIQLIYCTYGVVKWVVYVRAQKDVERFNEDDLYFEQPDNMGTQMIA